MTYAVKYINKILTTVKPLTVGNVVNFCKTELKKHYSENKLHNLEIARDYIIENYINTSQVFIEAGDDLPF